MQLFQTQAAPQGATFPRGPPLTVLCVFKVKVLEDEKKKLEKKLELLTKQDGYSANIDGILRREDDELEEKVDRLLRDKDKLRDDLDKITKETDDNKKRLSAVPVHAGDLNVLLDATGI